ncbi:MAG: helix-turn-helix domain-containing protein, partial [Victivallales bacterium]|nr:helix-turn-helix domain-containing protein [Victivallales bacterium]
LKRAALMLALTEQPISEILENVGFFDRSYFARQFSFIFGMTPRDFRSGYLAGTIDLTAAIKKLQLPENE